MSDIQQKPEQDLHGADAAHKVRDIARAAGVCMFTTRVGSYPGDTRPMAIESVDDNGTLWFVSSSESQKNEDLNADDRVLITVQGDKAHLSLSGRARIHTDRETVAAHWSAMDKLWFEGKDDPRVTVISVRPERGHYWESGTGVAGLISRLAVATLKGEAVGDGGVTGALTL